WQPLVRNTLPRSAFPPRGPRRDAMYLNWPMASLVGCALLVGPAAAQAPANQQRPAVSNSTAAQTHVDGWRASKLIGVNVYNEKNEKIGDINEIILDKS